MACGILFESGACYRRAISAEVERLIIECPSCQSKYQYDEERFERKPSKKIRCARCQEIFEIHNPAFAPREPVALEVGDSTFAARHQTRSTPLPTHESTEQSPIPAARVSSLQLPAGKRLSLAILDGPDAGSVFRIEKPRVTIGRSNADLTLNDSEASRQHAAVEVRDTSYMLSDLGSTNGTLFDGSKIEEAVELGDKSEFQVGGTTLMLIVTDEA
jgi:pSer/pThr/pTyr-binding forkhead associated (FHA) protein